MSAAVDPASVLQKLSPPRPWPRWGGAAALGIGGLMGGDLVLHLGHGLGQSVFNLTLAGAAALWLQARLRSGKAGLSATTLQGWLSRCEALLAQFDRLQALSQDGSHRGASAASPTLQAGGQKLPILRSEQLQQLRRDLQRPQLQLAIAGTTLPPVCCQGALLEALSGRHGLTLHWGTPLDLGASGWCWPAGLASCDLLLYTLVLPLSAADLRWLESRTADQNAWVLAQLPSTPNNQGSWQQDLAQQLPNTTASQLMLWDGASESLVATLEPLAHALRQDGLSLKQSARLQQAKALHQQWLLDLEQLRRNQLRSLLQRTQWLVAAGVLAAPAASLDLLVLAVANGLMLRQMAKLWDCPWSLEQLRSAAGELGQAALALGVLEWSNQALANVLRMHGSSWLIGGSLQALSAAYLTRVIGHAMADTMALSAGLSEPNLALIKARAPQLVSAAAEAEKLDWSAFLEQASTWMTQQTQPAPVAIAPSAS